MIELIALTIDNNICSVNGQIPVVLEAHLNRLRETIAEKTVVMGHNTYKSLGEPNTALQQTAKEVIVMSRHMTFPKPIKVCRTLIELLERFPDFIVIGGASLFADTMVMANIVYVTEVSERGESWSVVKTLPNLANNFTLKNPNAEFQHEGDTYFRNLIYTRK